MSVSVHIPNNRDSQSDLFWTCTLLELANAFATTSKISIYTIV